MRESAMLLTVPYDGIQMNPGGAENSPGLGWDQLPPSVSEADLTELVVRLKRCGLDTHTEERKLRFWNQVKLR